MKYSPVCNQQSKGKHSKPNVFKSAQPPLAMFKKELHRARPGLIFSLDDSKVSHASRSANFS